MIKTIFTPFEWLITTISQHGHDVVKAILGPVEWLITTFSRDGRRTFFDPDEFSWIKEIEAATPEIRKELESVLVRRENIPNLQDLSEHQKYLTQGTDWKTYFLYAYGMRIEENCARCPVTDRLVQKIPGMKTAMFSILAPGKHLPQHEGFYKGILRYHLGLIVPQPESLCRIRVGSDVKSWAEGRSLIFDDRQQHEVWNDSNTHRTVLFVDFVRPLPWPIDLLNRAVIRIMATTPYVTVGVNRARDAAREMEIGAAK
jgi:ornithine lipid ester-linked acyl 2-hydroxylase